MMSLVGRGSLFGGMGGSIAGIMLGMRSMVRGSCWMRMGVSIVGSFIGAPSMDRGSRPREMGKCSRASGETMSLSQNQSKFSARPTKPHFFHYKSKFLIQFPSKFNTVRFSRIL